MEPAKTTETFALPCSIASHAAAVTEEKAARFSKLTAELEYDENAAKENPTNIEETRKTSEYSRTSTKDSILSEMI